MSRPGVVEDANGGSVDAGSEADVSGTITFSLGHPSLPSAEEMGVGRASDEAACGGDEDPCVFAADSGSLAWPRPAELLDDVLPQVLTFCVADARPGQTGTWSSVEVRVDDYNTIVDQVLAMP